MQSRNSIRLHRKRRIRVKGTLEKPRVNVYRSLKNMYAQMIDDESGKTIVAVHTHELKSKTFDVKASLQLGVLLAKKAKEKGIEVAVFDRGGYQYHGKVKALADGLREGGLKI